MAERAIYFAKNHSKLQEIEDVETVEKTAKHTNLYWNK